MKLRHFYVPNRMPIQTLLHQTMKASEDCAAWKDKDPRFATPDWMHTALQYDAQVWFK